MERPGKQCRTKMECYQRSKNGYNNPPVHWDLNGRQKGRLITPDSSITSLDELADLSFYDLPTSMFQENIGLGNTLHLSELVNSPQHVSLPPHHAIAEARHIYTVDDSDHFCSLPTSFTQTMQNPTTPLQPSTQTICHQTDLERSRALVSDHQHGDKRVAFSHVKMPNGTKTSLDGSDSVFVATVGKPTIGVLSRTNHSNKSSNIQRPHEQQNESIGRNYIAETQERSTTSNPSEPKFLQGSCKPNRKFLGASYIGLSQQRMTEPPNQPAFSLCSNGSLRPRSQHNGTAGQSMQAKKYRHKTLGREQIKSVSFQDLGLHTVPDQAEKRSDYGFQITDDPLNSKNLTIPRYKQSNLSNSGKRLEEFLQYSRSQSAAQHPLRQLNGSSFEPLASRSFYITNSSSPKPLSPPTRDTDGILVPKSSTSDRGGAIQVLSLYDGKAVFKEHPSPAGISKNRVWQSNTQVELQHVVLKPDDEIGHKSSKRETWLPLSKIEETSNQFPLSTVGKTAARKRKGKEHPLNNSFESDTWSHLSLANSFSVDTSQRISSALWAMKLMEAAHSANPGTYQNLLLKARLFRRWLQKTRLKRTMKQEEQDKVESATAHWQTELLQKYFDAWRKCGQAMAINAEMLYKKHMLQKGLIGLKFAVQQQQLVYSDLQSKVKGRLLARYWLKWQKALKKKEMQCLKSAFGLWKSNQLKQNREKILEDMADRHVMSRNYTRWKMRYQVEQKNSVASLHYKICLLTKSWHCWRVYAAELVVKKRLKDVARVHHDERLTASLFTVWRQNTRKSLLAGNVAGRRLIVKAFCRWKNWSQYAKVIRLRFQSMCKEYHYKALVKAAFIKWQIRLQNKRADKFRRQTQHKRIFKLWYLRYRRKIIHRHLCKALAKKSKKRKFFTKWKNFTKVQQDKRKRFVESVNLMALKRLFGKWKELAAMKSSLRTTMINHSRRRDQQLTRKAMDKWLFAMKIVNFRKRVYLNWSRRCTRKACKNWKLLLRKKYLEQRLIDVSPTLKMLVMRRTFKKWLAQKRRADEEKEKIAHVKIILERNAKLRVLQAWRVANQESQIIAPMAARRERKVIARVFDAWRLHVYRQNHIVDHLARARETLLDKFFLHWRSRTVLIEKERNAIESLCHSKVSRHFKAWRGFVLDVRLERLRKRAGALSLMQRYFNIWKSKVEEKHEAKDEQDASAARQRLLVSWVFNFWCESAKRLRDRLNEQEQQLISQNKRVLLARVFRRWLKLYRNKEKARMHVKHRRDEFLRKIVRAWRKDTKETLEKEVFNFTTSLTLDSSLGSVFGSTFRSTLGSSYHSDALSTSGYGTDMRMRRGSGPVPVQYLKIDDRDDEVISLPGRFDQLRSPTIKTSPITVLREASSGRMSPQIVQQDNVLGHDSPRSVSTNSHHPISPLLIQPTTPSSSPEQMLPSFTCTVPVKSEDDALPAVGLHSGSDESEEQDDRGSVLSSFSMTGRSIDSIRDREMVLTDTILHWRLLPLSLTFRTWMKFTRQRKLLRELLFYLREKKRKEIMAQTLKKWRRELFVKFTAREHWLYKTRHKYLIAWHGYVKQSRIKEERKFIADKHRRIACLGRFLRTWRDRYNRKKRLQKFVIHWRKEALVSKQHKNITETVKCKRNSRLLKDNFLHWMELTKKSQNAKAFYFGKLLPKFFAAWHVFIREVVTRKQKLVIFAERRLLSMCFREWQMRFVAVRRADDLIEVKETNLLLEILKRWHSWAEGMSLRRSRAQYFRRSAELRTMKEIFAMWNDRSQQLRNSTKAYEHKVMRRVLFAWQSFTVLGIENRQKLHEFREARARNLVRRSFNFWHCLQIHSERARSNVLEAERRLVKKCFGEWRYGTLKQRAHKHNGHRLQRKMFLFWYDQHTRRKTARRLISNWRSKTEEAKIMNSKALDVVQEREKKLLRQSFDIWVLEAHKIQKAKNHASINCLQRAFVAWYTYAHTRVQQRRMLAAVEGKKRQTLLCDSFTAWSQLFQRRVHNLEILKGFLERKQTQLLKVCMVKWWEDTLNCRAQKFHNRRLVQKCFVEWWFRLYTKKGLESVKEKILTRKTREAAQHWRRWTVRVKKQTKQAGDLHSKLEERLLHDYFGRWVLASRQVQKAEYYHRQVVIKRSLRNWRSAVQRRLEEQRKMKKFQQRLNSKRMTKMFSNWRSALKTVTRHQHLVAKQMAVHNSRMLKHAMVRWRKFIMKRRAEKHHNIVCIAKCFLDWKIKTEDKLKEKENEQLLQEKADRFYRLKLSKTCFRGWLYDFRADQYERLRLSRLVERAFSTWKKKCSLNTIAKELVDRRLFDKYWNLWRRQLIRKRVSELMQKHEEKKLLSEVFVAWFRLVLVRRQLLRAYKTYVTKKWFIKWMQKYNES